MARRNSIGRSRTATLGTIGHVDHGKTTLTAALTKVSADKGWTKEAVSYDQVAKASESQGRRDPTKILTDRDLARGVLDGQAALRPRRLPGPCRLRQEHDHRARRRWMAPSSWCPAVDGPMPQTREHILLARRSGVPYIVVFLNKCDAVDDQELVELVEMEVRELLSKYQFPGDDIPIIRGAAIKALNGEKGPAGRRRPSSSCSRRSTRTSRCPSVPRTCPS
jgi:elongation factor Tu